MMDIQKIPQANPLAESIELMDELNAAIERVIRGGHYIKGPEVEAFEHEFADYIGVPYAVSVASGTDALKLALCSLGIRAGDEVITVSHTAVATVAAIEQCGALPVLVDIDPATFTLDAEKLRDAITSKTRVVIPVHLYGHPAALDAILRIASQYGLDVLEDCAQAHGASYNGRRVGKWGRIAAFSFYPTKNLGALGDGGMIVTKDAELAQKARLLREYGWKDRYISDVPGFNSRLDEIQAAILRVKLHHLDFHNQARRTLAEAYSQALAGCVRVPFEATDAFHVYHLYVIRTAQRDALRAFLAENGIGTAIHYPVPVHLQPAYTALHVAGRSLKLTEDAATEILSLPLYPQMQLEQANYVADKIKEFFK